MRYLPKLPVIIIIVLLIPIKAFSTDIPDPRYKTIEYIKWYPSHYYNAIKRTVSFKTHRSVLLAGALLLPTAFIIDNRVQNYAQKRGFYSKSISKIGDLYGNPWGYIGGITLVTATGFISKQPFPKTISQVQLIAESVQTTALITSILKDITHRERPNRKSYKSFPSGHTSGSFALAACLNEIYGKKVGYLAYFMAGFVASSRINDNKHYLSDVIAAAILGTIIGKSFAVQHLFEFKIYNDKNNSNTSISYSFKL